METEMSPSFFVYEKYYLKYMSILYLFYIPFLKFHFR